MREPFPLRWDSLLGDLRLSPRQLRHDTGIGLSLNGLANGLGAGNPVLLAVGTRTGRRIRLNASGVPALSHMSVLASQGATVLAARQSGDDAGVGLGVASRLIADTLATGNGGNLTAGLAEILHGYSYAKKLYRPNWNILNR